MGDGALGWPAGIAALSLLLGMVAPARAVVYVDIDNAAGPWDGESWATAYRTVHEGLNAAHDAGGGEVWVAEATYKPTSTTDRSVSFELKPGVAIYGGFRGAETARDQRDWATHVTVLSGDIGTPGDPSDNSYHVVTGTDDAAIDGFTITGGNADGEGYSSKGGGMVSYDTSFRMNRRPGPPRAGGGSRFLAGSGFSPTVANCIFTGNSAREGGAMYNFDDASATLTNCTFTANSADKGGAIVNRMASNCTVSDCTFRGNHATWRGGAAVNDYGSSATFANCRFIENSTDGNGGGMYTDDTSSQIGHTSPVVRDCAFVSNTAGLRGGGIANYNKCTPTIEGCTFTGNRAGTGGGAIANDYRVTVAVTDCTFADNSAAEGEADVDSDRSSRLTSSPRRPRAPTGLPTRTVPAPRLRTQQLAEATAEPTGTVVYVSVLRPANTGDGRAWATACGSLQEGIDAASRAGGGEVWVAAGTYRPTSTADRAASFELKPGVALYGGFRGAETARAQRDCISNVTVLSGDIGTPGDASDNSYHVVKGADGAIIDGFTITGGNALPGAGRGPGFRPGGGRPGAPGRGNQHLTPEIIAGGARTDGCGAGMLNIRGAPTVVNCIFSDNAAGKGGGMYNMCARRPGPGGSAREAPTLINCIFSGNYAGGRGGGMSNDLSTHPTLVNCDFVSNATGGKGGGMYNDFNCSPTLTNCVFAGNSAERGGGMANDGSSCPTLTNCTFTGNHARDLGGALYNGTYRPGGIACSPTVTNCILWGNSTPSGPRQISNWHEDAPKVTFCVVEGGYEGEGNLDADPLFVDAESGDYRLRSGSPGIAAASRHAAPTDDRDGNARPDPADMGAYQWLRRQ